mmetsp:Transcript_5114/g.7796  ORF Transcript_5114/g.7796 Transcript_5114/m.7796 type:complete len:211 (-) Transcript_5114:2032-2664(-)
MDGVGVEVLVIGVDTVLHVLVHVIGDERSDARHQGVRVMENIEEDVQADHLLLNAVLSLHPGAVEADVGVRQELEEGNKGSDDVIELVVIHLITDELDQILVARHDPLVHHVAALSHLVLHLLVENEVLSSGSLIASDVLDQESVGIEPREEDFSDHVKHSLLAELKRFSSDDGGVAEVQPAGISTVVLGNSHGIGVVLLALGHLLAVFS